MVLLLLAWTAAAGALTLPEGTRKLAWDTLVTELARAEDASAGPTDIYASESFIAAPLTFYLERANETRFRVTVLDNPVAVDRDHFWFAYRDTTWKGERPLSEILAAKGYQVGTGFEIATASQTVLLFPAWRR
jgi:hypothetical protein